MVHVVYCDDKEQELEAILEGETTMVVRGATGRKIPHSRVFPGERLYLMKKGSGVITAAAVVQEVFNHTKLTDAQIEQVFDDHRHELRLSPAQRKRWHKRCLCLVRFAQVESIPPLQFERQGNMDDWLIIERIEDVLVGTSKPFTYEHARLKK